MSDYLKLMGELKWELISTHNGDGNIPYFYLFFKRPITQPQPNRQNHVLQVQRP